MEKNLFSDALFNQIKEQVLLAKKQNPPPYYAAFDADGTLWDSDMGEQFFEYQIQNCDLKSLEGIDPWKHYKDTKSTDPVSAYLWLAQISAGQPLEQVRQWAKEAIKKHGAKVFESQKKLIAWLQENGVEVFIVTASIQWAVEPAAFMVGVPFENVMGIQTGTDEKGLVTNQQSGPITWRQGKAEALMARTQGVAPIFCSGNTYGDTALIETSIGAKLCVQTQTEENSLYQEEIKLRKDALEKDWLIHHFFE